MTQAAQFIQDLAVIMIAAAVGGLLCKRAGLSPIVGYLAAGILVGPHTPFLPAERGFVDDPERVHVLAQLGLVFLMFGIGLGFSLRRMRQLGLPVILATAGTAFLVFNLGRLGAGAIGLDRIASVFFAGMLVSSSSAVIGKLLTEAGRTHEKSSQLAVGITLSEDLVAIVMLTLLGSYVQFGSEGADAGRAGVLPTVALFGGFVLALALAGLLVVPRVLHRLSREASTELETIFVAALLFGLSLMVVRSGYSIALGAFLLGAIISETPQRAQVERAFSGLRDFFSAIFFVAIGMTIDIATMKDAIVPLLVLTVLALAGRSICASLMMLLLGYDTRTAVRAGLILTPLGEFGFIVAQLGTTSLLLPAEYMSAVVGASLLTALFSPLLVRHNAAVAERIASRRVPFLDRALALHRRILEALQRQRKTSLLWKLTRKRLVQVGVEVVLISMALGFAEPVIAWIVQRFGPEVVPDLATAVVCWTALGLLLLAPLIAVLRNIQALSMIFADYLSHHGAAFARVKPVVTTVMQGAAVIALVLWWWNFVPLQAGLWLTVGVVAFLAVMATLLWRRMIRWHSHLEYAINASLNESPGGSISYAWMDRYSPWGLQVGEVTLPDRFAYAGRSIGEIGIRQRFGCTLIGIERQSFMVPSPGPTSHLFPGDRVLLLGTDSQIAATREALLADRTDEQGSDTFIDLAVELVDLPPGSPAAGRTLAALNWPRLFGVQVVGHERTGQRLLTPPADLQLQAGDRILVLGTPRQVATLREVLLPQVHPSGPQSDAT